MNVAYIITSRRHVAEYEVGFLSCLHFAKRNSLYSEVTLKPKKVIFGGNIFLNYDKSLIFCLIPAWIFAKKNGIKCACSISFYCVVSPFNALIENRISWLCESGIRATALRPDSTTAKFFARNCLCEIRMVGHE